MVTAKNVVDRYKLAKGPRTNWVPFTKDGVKNVRATVRGKDGEWVFNATMKEGDTHWKIQITVPRGSKNPSPGTYERSNRYPASKLEDAKKELGFWINDIHTNGTVVLTGWTKV